MDTQSDLTMETEIQFYACGGGHKSGGGREGGGEVLVCVVCVRAKLRLMLAHPGT